MASPTVSVVIPCHNHGPYLNDAVQSVLAQTCQDFEVVVVDDGSTDRETLRILDDFRAPRARIIRTNQQGLAAARNNGIAACTGQYILPLDADDKIGRSYLEKAVALLNAQPNLGIVYCKAEYFGDVSGPWTLPEYKFPDILYGNMIFCSALFRREDWAKAGGYNPNMIYGWEDYDLWLSLIELGREVYCIPETLFFYRQRPDSMTTLIKREHAVYSYAQLFRNHPKLYADNMGVLLLRLGDFRELRNSLWWRIYKLPRLVTTFFRGREGNSDVNGK